MNKAKIVFSFSILLILISNVSYSQLFPRFSIAGGPYAGMHFPKVNDLNAEMRKMNVPEFKTGGYFTMGGGGFIDLPFQSVNWLRIGGMGTGFTSETPAVSDASGIIRSARLSFGMGGITLEYRNTLGGVLDITAGAFLGTGELKVNVYQRTGNFGNWNTIVNEIGSGSPSQNVSREIRSRFFSAQPQVGVGIHLAGFLYAKLNAGYIFTSQGDWKSEDNIKIINVPSGIKADGFVFNFGLNFGIFTQ